MTADASTHARLVGRLEQDSPLVLVADGTFETTLSHDWGTGDAPNGGYLISLIMRAIGRVLPAPHPLTTTAHYNARVEAGPAIITVEPTKVGRTLGRATARLMQDGRECIRVMAVSGVLETEPVLYTTPPGFELAPLDQCDALQLGTPGGVRSTVRERFEIRYDPDSVGWARGEPSGTPRMSAWVRPKDGSEPDIFMLPVVADALPATAFDVGYTSWVPTIELTVHVRAEPAPGWLRAGYSSRQVAGGLMEEDCEIWDSAGRLVLMSRQLVLVAGAQRNGTRS